MLAFSIYLVFVVSYFLHLTSRVPALGAIRFDFVLMIVLFVFFLLSLGTTYARFKDSGITKKLFYFILFFLLTIPLVKWPGSVVKYGSEWYFKVVFFYFFTLAFVTTEKRLKIFMAVFLGCQFFRGLEPAWMHYTVGYWGDLATSHVGGELLYLNRLSGAPHDIINPNQLAWVIVNTIPFIYFLGWVSRGYVWKFCSMLLFAGLLYSLMLTGSRSGLICLFAVFIGIVFFSEKRWKNLAICCLVIIPAGLVISGLLSPDLAERYRSIFDSAAVGADTVHGRINGLKNNLSTIMNAYGMFGHGLGTSSEVNMNYLQSSQPSHDLYLEILQEVGVVGFIIFLRYLYEIFHSLNLSLKKVFKDRKQVFLVNTVRALLVWQFMQMIYDLSCFGLSSWEWYLFGGLAAVTILLAKEQERMMDTSEDGLSSLEESV